MEAKITNKSKHYSYASHKHLLYIVQIHTHRFYAKYTTTADSCFIYTVSASPSRREGREFLNPSPQVRGTKRSLKF